MFFKQGALVERSLVTATSAGTLTLISTSETYQIFTGSTTHILKLPDATTMPNGRRFELINASTGDITVQDSTAAVIGTVATGVSKIFRLADNSTAAGTFDITAASSGANRLSTQESSQFNAIAAKGFSSTSVVLKYNPEEIGGNFWTTKAPLSSARLYTSNVSLNRFSYSAGGDTGSVISTNDRFNDESNYWLNRTSVPTVTKGGGSFVVGGKFNVVGGDNASVVTNLNYQYTDTTDVWATRTVYPTNISYPMAASIAGYGLITGGGTGNAGGGPYVFATYIFDDTANTWYLKAPGLINANSQNSAFVLNDFFYEVGGLGGVYFLSTAKFNYATNSWTPTANLPAAYGYTGAFSSNGAGYLSGGLNAGQAFTPLKYLDTTNVFTSIAAAANVKWGSGSANINGRGYSWGGSNFAGTKLSVNEQYSDASIFRTAISFRSTTAPTAISASVVLNALTQSVPVQLRTDGDNWKTFTSGGSVLKQGETLAAKFQYSPMPYTTGGYNGSAPISTTSFYSASQNTWVSRQSQVAARYQQSGFSLDGNGYTLAGFNDTVANNENKSYSDITNTFTTKTSTPAAHRDGSGNSLNGFGYIYNRASLSADTTQRFSQYSSTTNAFVDKTVITTDVNGAQMLSSADRLWVAGGDSIGGVQSSNFAYSDVTNTWATKTAIGFSRTTYAGFTLNGKNYVAGGLLGSQSNALETYNIGTDSWTHSGSGTGDLPVSIYHNRGFVGDGYGYSIGGFTGSYTAQFAQFNPFSLAWVSKTTNGIVAMPSSGFAPSPFRNYEMRVGIPAYYAGVGNWVTVTRIAVPVSAYGFGFVLSDRSYQPVGNDNLWYEQNTTLNSWAAIANSTYSAQYKATFSLLGFGYAAGGNTGLTSTSQYNPSSGAWAATGALNNSVGYAAGATLNGSGYLLGGFNGGVTTFIQKYNPSLGTWASAGSLNSAKYSLDGDSCAGFIYLGGNTSSAFERYNDATQTTTLMATVLDNNTDGMAGCKGDKFYYFRGSGGTVYEYSTQGNFWAIKPSITNRYYIAGGNIGGNFYLSGGSTGLTTNEAYVDSLKQAVLSAGLNIS